MRGVHLARAADSTLALSTSFVRQPGRAMLETYGFHLGIAANTRVMRQIRITEISDRDMSLFRAADVDLVVRCTCDLIVIDGALSRARFFGQDFRVHR